MENPIKMIHRFNHSAGLVDRPKSAVNECAYWVEEALEGFSLEPVANRVGYTGELKEREIAKHILGNEMSHITNLTMADKAGDAVVFAVGALVKMGLDPQGVTAVLNAIMQANLAKLADPEYDSEGKLKKKVDFIGPEERIRGILEQNGIGPDEIYSTV